MIRVWLYPSGKTIVLSDECVTVSALLEKLGLDPDNVLVVHNGRILGHKARVCGGTVKVLEQGVGG